MFEFDKEWMFLVVKWPLIVIILALLLIGLWNVVQFYFFLHNKKGNNLFQDQAIKPEKEISVIIKKIEEIKAESW
jgi:hypothetical protein